MLRTKELKELAQKATPGTWTYDNFGGISAIDPVDGEIDQFISSQGYSFATEEDYRFIAAANPDTVLALIERVENVTQELAELRAKLADNATKE